MTCPRCGSPAQRRKNGIKNGRQTYRTSCRSCRSAEQRQSVGRAEVRMDTALRVQVAIDKALGRPW